MDVDGKKRRPCGSITMLMMLVAVAACAPARPGLQDTVLAPEEPAYDYPIMNPYAATVIGMPPESKVDVSAMPAPEEKRLTLFRQRTVPDGFWYERGLRYGELLQDKPAPLVYVIAGTGGSHRAAKMQELAHLFYGAGFHVVLLPSPTHPNFIINASADYLSERPVAAARDLYRVMKRIDRRVRKETTVTGRMLTGYSLGALQAAFVARHDADVRALNFSRVLLINPPYSLYSSVGMIDRMLLLGMPGGMDDADQFIQRLMARLGDLNPSGDALDFDNERLLLDAYEQDKLDTASIATTIGLSFRLSAASMIFTNDVMSRRGYVFPKESSFHTSTDLSTVLAVALRISFTEYFRDYYLQKAQALQPGLTHATLAHESSLEYLAPYIRGNPKFGLVTNMDDIILAPGEVEKLALLFGPRARVFQNGGHLGNMAHPAVAHAIVHFMRDGGQP